MSLVLLRIRVDFLTNLIYLPFLVRLILYQQSFVMNSWSIKFQCSVFLWICHKILKQYPLHTLHIMSRLTPSRSTLSDRTHCTNSLRLPFLSLLSCRLPFFLLTACSRLVPLHSYKLETAVNPLHVASFLFCRYVDPLIYILFIYLFIFVALSILFIKPSKFPQLGPLFSSKYTT
jgi:hypothetical protein